MSTATTIPASVSRMAVACRRVDAAVPRRAVRLARIVALAVIIGVGVNHLYWSVTDWHLKDMNAYWDAGLRLRQGAALYPPGIDIEASEVFRYSPWFAWLWVPLTYLPRLVVNIGWSAVLLCASFAAVWPLARRRAWVAVAFFLPLLIGISAIGNVQSLLIAAVVLGVERRSGPLWIAIAASLKLFPILLILTYLGRRTWRRSAATFALTALLLAPFLLYDLTGYATGAGDAGLLWRWPVVYGATVVALALAALFLARGRWGWLASAVAVTMALPRFFVYDVTYLLISYPQPAPDDRTVEEQ